MKYFKGLVAFFLLSSVNERNISWNQSPHQELQPLTRCNCSIDATSLYVSACEINFVKVMEIIGVTLIRTTVFSLILNLKVTFRRYAFRRQKMYTAALQLALNVTVTNYELKSAVAAGPAVPCLVKRTKKSVLQRLTWNLWCHWRARPNFRIDKIIQTAKIEMKAKQNE